MLPVRPQTMLQRPNWRDRSIDLMERGLQLMYAALGEDHPSIKPFKDQVPSRPVNDGCSECECVIC